MSVKLKILMAIATALALSRDVQANVYAVSTFDAGDEGWETTWDSNFVLSQWQPVGGNPDGYLSGVDANHGVAWYYHAPDEFEGDMTAFYGGTLDFDLIVNTQNNIITEDIADVAIFGNGVTLLHSTAYNPGVAWTHYSVALDPSAPWYAVVGDVPIDQLRTYEMSSLLIATEAQMLQVFSDVNDLYIRGEYSHGPDQGGLDNAIIARVTDGGTTTAMLGLGLISLGWAGRCARRKTAT
ncbi:MAG TPA: laminin B domain-containing protein [Kiritimatiellia bacterium]|jgi:hypothetical protein